MKLFSKKYDELEVEVFQNREQMGIAASDHVVALIKKILAEKEFVNMIFAAAPSQNDFLEHFTKSGDVEWSRINGFHMDEYTGLDKNADQLFSKYLVDHLFGKVKMNRVFLIDSQADPATECKRYAELLKQYPTDIVCMGIGENGHIAFNDPPVADFGDSLTIKEVKLDDICRQQQVNDGCFKTFDDVPDHALSLTIPALFSAKHLSVVVPTIRKAKAVIDTVTCEIKETVPATILRKHSSAKMFLDIDAAVNLPLKETN